MTALQDGRNFGRGCRKNVAVPMACEKLKEFVFLHEPRRCLACGCQSLGPPVENSASDELNICSLWQANVLLQEQRCVVQCFFELFI